MSLIPTLPELLARARADLRMGLPVVIDGYLAASVETLTSARLRDIRALGAAQIVITDRRAQTLKARIYEAGLARLALPAEADMYWLRSVADPSAEWDIPMKGPFIAEREGAVPAHAAALALAKSAQLLPAMLMLPVETPDGLTRLPAEASLTELAAEAAMSHVTAARVPLSRAEKSRLHIYRPDTGGVDHYAIEIGEPDREGAVLVRLHSACYTGDVLGSLKCDCGPQLHAALDMMGQAGQGMLLYLNQEGRGIGLTNKMRAYSLQDQGFDTVEANHRLGFEDDERDFRLGAEMLRKMGISRVRLLTNNPRKVEMLSAQGIDVVERVPLVVPTNRFNEGYLATKAKKSGHLL